MEATAARDTGQVPCSFRQEAEQKLVNNCIAGEEKAWEELVLRYSRPLRSRIGAMLGARGRDANLVDEIVAEVWSTLFRRNGSLLGRFRAENGKPLIAFLGGIARIELLRFLRSDHQRRCHETSQEVIQQAADSTDDDGHRLISVGLSEFTKALTPRERQFLHENLLNGMKVSSSSEFTTANRWQLRHRIRRKLLAFLDEQ